MKRDKNVICRDREGNVFKVPTDQLSFRPSVYGVILEKGKILLSRQWDGYDFPGGGIELGETIHDGLIREVREETGFNVKIDTLLAAENSFFKLPIHHQHVHSILLYYRCHIVGGQMSTRLASHEERSYLGDPVWIDISTLHDIKFYNSIDSKTLIRRATSTLLMQCE